MPSLTSQTLVQRLKQQRERLQHVQKQQKSGRGEAAPITERRTKRKHPQHADENEQQQRQQRKEDDDSSSIRAHKKQRPAPPAQPRPATAQRPTTRTQTKPTPAPHSTTRPHPKRAANTPTPRIPTPNNRTQPDDDHQDDGHSSRSADTAVKAEGGGPAKRIKNPQVYLDLAIDQQPIGRIVIELFQYASPRTVANFRALCTGERGIGSSGRPLHYLHSRVHRIDPAFAIQLGDITNGDGTGGDSIYGEPSFPHEPSHRRHSGFGTVSTSAALHSTVGASSTFFISTSHEPLRWLDKRHTVFGRVVRGKQVLLDIERLAGRRKGGIPKAEVTISGCGSMRKQQQQEEEQRRKERHQLQTAKVKLQSTCPRCDSAGKVNKKTRKGVRVWCTNEHCKYCWYEALSDWDEARKAEFVVKETKRREEEERREREEEDKRAELDGEEGDEEDDEDEEEDDEEGGEEDEQDDEQVEDEEEDADDDRSGDDDEENEE